MKSLLASVPNWREVAAEQAGTTLTVDLDALAANWCLLAGMVGTAECAAVVKADAYGLGLEASVGALLRAGCRTFFVAHVFEGQALRALSSDAVIYVLNGLMPRTAPLFTRFGLRPVLGSPLEIEDWLEAAPRLPCALQLDSGMNRLGLIGEASAAPLPGIARLNIALIMSHFVWSGREGHGEDVAKQIDRFEAARSRFPGAPASLANSSGIFYGAPAHYDVVRPGYALYGGNPIPDRPNPMRSVVIFEAKVIQVHEVGAGDSVGYDAHWIAPGPRRLATISAGYADGVPTAAVGTNTQTRGQALVDGALCPFVGRISMDLIVVDVTDAPAINGMTASNCSGPISLLTTSPSVRVRSATKC